MFKRQRFKASQGWLSDRMTVQTAWCRTWMLFGVVGFSFGGFGMKMAYDANNRPIPLPPVVEVERSTGTFRQMTTLSDIQKKDIINTIVEGKVEDFAETWERHVYNRLQEDLDWIRLHTATDSNVFNKFYEHMHGDGGVVDTNEKDIEIHARIKSINALKPNRNAKQSMYQVRYAIERRDGDQISITDWIATLNYKLLLSEVMNQQDRWDNGIGFKVDYFDTQPEIMTSQVNSR